jgi:mRNA-degrading endonuclease RelE of RelBE toxin-antitoxin system
LTNEHWTYLVTPPAERDLRRLDRPIKQRVVNALDHFVANPRAGDTRKLTNCASVIGACASTSTTKPTRSS